MKRPASQYYWGDWRRDTALQSCSLASRGLWHEMNCLMHDCEPYGHLCVGAAPMTSAQLARLVGITPRECAALLTELEAASVFSRTDAGVIYSRRMVRDEAVRERRATGGQAGAEHGAKGARHGSKGGRPRTKNPPSSSAEGGFETPHAAAKQPPPASASAIASEIQGAPSVFPAREGATEGARARDGPGPEQPASADAAVREVVDAVREAGYPDVSVGDPVLRSLVAQGLGPLEAVDAATAGSRAGKGWGWVVSRIAGRRGDAAALSLAPAAPGQPWHATRSGIEAKGVELGLGRWDEQAAQLGRGEAFAAYEARVRSAADGGRVAA